METHTSRIILWTAVMALAALINTGAANADDKDRDHRRPVGKVVKFDVAEDAERFVFDEAPVFASDGFPAYGNPFVTRGYIYPHGFLDGREGVLASGEPAYPSEVIGVWTCRGVFIGDGAHTTTGPWVMTTQHYDFFEEPGWQPGKYDTSANLISEGYEIADVGVRFKRAVTGGTGDFRHARGEVVQELLGFNDLMGVRLRFEARVR